MMAKRFTRLSPECKVDLEVLRASGSRDLLQKFVDRYGMSCQINNSYLTGR
jgi:hypothetical protein